MLKGKKATTFILFVGHKKLKTRKRKGKKRGKEGEGGKRKDK
jgi:hypothetical protein